MKRASPVPHARLQVSQVGLLSPHMQIHLIVFFFFSLPLIMLNYSHHLSFRQEVLGTRKAVTFNSYSVHIALGPDQGQLVT